MDFYKSEAAYCSAEDVLTEEERMRLNRAVDERGCNYGSIIDDSVLLRLSRKVYAALSELADCECQDEDIECLVALGNAIEAHLASSQKLQEMIIAREFELTQRHGISLFDHVEEIDSMRVDLRLRSRLEQIQRLRDTERWS